MQNRTFHRGSQKGGKNSNYTVQVNFTYIIQKIKAQSEIYFWVGSLNRLWKRKTEECLPDLQILKERKENIQSPITEIIKL